MMDMCCGDEVKGEGYILNLILYSFLYIRAAREKIRFFIFLIIFSGYPAHRENG